MKKDIVMTMGSFSKKVSRDLKKKGESLKITLEGILYSGGVKVRKFQLVSKKKFNWYILLTLEENSSLKEIENSLYC